MPSNTSENRKLVLKYFGFAAAIQTSVCLLSGLAAWILPSLGFLLVAGFYFYAPTILLISVLGSFSGESAMIWPILLGIPAGILLYSLIFALALNRRRKRRI